VPLLGLAGQGLRRLAAVPRHRYQRALWAPPTLAPLPSSCSSPPSFVADPGCPAPSREREHLTPCGASTAPRRVRRWRVTERTYVDPPARSVPLRPKTRPIWSGRQR